MSDAGSTPHPPRFLIHSLLLVLINTLISLLSHVRLNARNAPRRLLCRLERRHGASTGERPTPAAAPCSDVSHAGRRYHPAPSPALAVGRAPGGNHGGQLRASGGAHVAVMVGGEGGCSPARSRSPLPGVSRASRRRSSGQRPWRASPGGCSRDFGMLQ